MTKPTPLEGLAALVLLLSLATFALVFFSTPMEMQMGIVQKIFYIHVPSAYAMYLGFAVSAVASGLYLWRRREGADAWALAGVEVGLLFCSVVLITGPLWARKAWGVWWTWDPRLTTTLLAGLVFAAALAVRGSGSGGETEKRFAAAVTLVGFLDLPLIHYSVQRWRGQHPQVISKGGGGLAPEMLPALWVSFATFTAMALLLLWLRVRLARQERLCQTLQWRIASGGDHD